MCKRISFIFVLLICAVTFAAHAESDGSTFTISSNVALPVTVKPNGKSAFKIYSRSYTTAERIANATITDANGNRCMTHHTYSHSGGNVHHYWKITGVYSSSSSNSSSGNSYTSETHNTGIADIMSEWGRNWIPYDCNGHPYLALGLGVSKSCGEFARLKWTHGGSAGLVLSGSIGKDWIFKEEYADKILWNVGAGVRFSNENNEFEWNLLVGRTPWHPDPAILMNLEYAHYFGESKFFGLFGNIGFAGTNLSSTNGDKAKAYFDFSIGVAIKLWQR